MNWTTTDTAHLVLLAMALFGACCIVWGMRISNRLKKESSR